MCGISPELLIALLGISNIEIEEVSLSDDKRELLILAACRTTPPNHATITT
jgi:hypothetical protein